MIINVYEYLFYRLYRWSEKVNGEQYFNTYSASLMISLPVWANLATVLILACSLSGVRLELDMVSNSLVAVAAILYCSTQYLYFKKCGRDIKILSRYKSEDSGKFKRRGYWVFVYVVGSIVTFIILLLILPSPGVT